MVAKAKVRIEGEDATAAAWRSAANQAQATAKKITGFFKFAVGAASLAAVGSALTSAAKQAIDFGDSINKASIKAGIGNKAMSELAYAAKLADVDIASLSTALKKMQVSLSEAGTGAKLPTTALAALGLTIQDVQKRKPEAQFELLADRISKLTDPADRARAAVELFGKAGADLLPLFEQGAAGIAKARAEAEKLGLSFSDEQIKKLAAADDSIKRLDASWKGFAATLTALVAPALASVFDTLSGGDSRGLNKQIADLEKTIANMSGLIGPEFEKRRNELVQRLNKLRGDQEFEGFLSGRGNTAGEPTRGGSAGTAVGFAAADAAAKAEEAAKKAGEAEVKHRQKVNEMIIDSNHEMADQMNKIMEESLDRDYKKYVENEDKKRQATEESQKALEEWRAEQAEKLSENAQIFKDAFLNAWDDMVNNGKFKIDELFKYIIAEFARRGIAKLFDSIFSGGTAGGGIGGWIDKGIKAIGGIFGGARANGGPVQGGKSYLVGERGMEMFTPGTSGSITPNDAMGGGISIDARTSIDARGASMELMNVLPKLLEQNRKATVAEVVDGLRRRRYAT